MVGVPVISAIFVVISWRFYRRWRNNKPITRTASVPQTVEAKVEPKEESPPSKDLKEVKTRLVSL